MEKAGVAAVPLARAGETGSASDGKRDREWMWHQRSSGITKCGY